MMRRLGLKFKAAASLQRRRGGLGPLACANFIGSGERDNPGDRDSGDPDSREPGNLGK